MATYAQLQKQIEKLQADAEAQRRRELADVIAKVRETIEAYGLTAADLGFGAKASVKKGRPATRKTGRAGAGVPKYRDPETGRTWTGFGKPPSWIAGVQDRTPYLIGSGASADSGAASKKAAKKVVRKRPSAPSKRRGKSAAEATA